MEPHTNAQPRTRGMRTGQPNPGAFKKGDDPRRAGGLKVVNGKTLAQLAREHTPEAVALVARCITDETQRMCDRLRASELILDRGWGRPTSVVEMNVTHGRALNTLTMQELEALARGETPRLPITLEGEAGEVLTAFPTVSEHRGDAT
jgi:hypothetical protein